MEDKPSWMQIAERERGIREFKDGSNPQVEKYLATVPGTELNDRVPWCSAFINWVMLEAKIRPTYSGLARSWLSWGFDLTEPKKNCIVIIRRGNEPWMGHVGILENWTDDYLWIYGGNQGDMVKTTTFRRERELGYRWPFQLGDLRFCGHVRDSRKKRTKKETGNRT